MFSNFNFFLVPPKCISPDKKEFSISQISTFWKFFCFILKQKWKEFTQTKNASKRCFWNYFSSVFALKTTRTVWAIEGRKNKQFSRRKNLKNFNFVYFPKIFELQICFLMKIIIFKFDLLNKNIHSKKIIFRRQMGWQNFGSP